MPQAVKKNQERMQETDDYKKETETGNYIFKEEIEVYEKRKQCHIKSGLISVYFVDIRLGRVGITFNFLCL